MDKNKSTLKINEYITTNELRIIGNNGEALGIMSNSDAQQLARDEDLDLVLIVPDAKPPVARVVSINKYNYELKKRQKAQAKSARPLTRLKLKKLNLDLALAYTIYKLKCVKHKSLLTMVLKLK